MQNTRTWVQLVDGEPSICIGRSYWGKKKAYVLPLSVCYEFLNNKGIIEKTLQIAKFLGFDPVTQHELFKLSTMIIDRIDEVCKLAPESQKETEEREQKEMRARGYIVEGTANINGKEVEFNA